MTGFTWYLIGLTLTWATLLIWQLQHEVKLARLTGRSSPLLEGVTREHRDEQGGEDNRQHTDAQRETGMT